MHSLNATQIFTLSGIVIVIAYDVWLFLSGRETISQLVQKTCSGHSWVAAALGALLWHLLTGGQ